MRGKPTNTPIIHSVYWLCMVAPTRFGITLPSSGNIPSAFWEMLNWGAVDKIKATKLNKYKFKKSNKEPDFLSLQS
jgi:hypothetical protein